MTPCVLWAKAVNAGGYGITTTGSRTDGSRRGVLAHRLAWEKANGPIPEGLCVLHRCDLRRCINVEHLWLGTCADNNRDRDAKGRTARGDATVNRVTKINGATAESIRIAADRFRRPNGRLRRGSRSVLAERFRVSQRLVQSVLNGETWRRPDVDAMGPYAVVTVLPE